MASAISIAHAKYPKWYNDTMASLYVVLDDKSVVDTLYLFGPLFFASYFKCIWGNGKVGDSGTYKFVTQPHLIKEECLTQITNI